MSSSLDRRGPIWHQADKTQQRRDENCATGKRFAHRESDVRWPRLYRFAETRQSLFSAGYGVGGEERVSWLTPERKGDWVAAATANHQALPEDGRDALPLSGADLIRSASSRARGVDSNGAIRRPSLSACNAMTELEEGTFDGEKEDYARGVDTGFDEKVGREGD